MGELRLDYCCRLCLKEGFSLTNIFSHRSPAGDYLYQILNFIYEMKIFQNDGLPSKICSPCMWRMIEFDACKKNVRSAEAEIIRLLNQTRPRPDEAYNDSLLTKTEDTEMDEASEVGIECDTVHSEVPIKEELDIVDSERLIETVAKGTVNAYDVGYVRNCNEQVFSWSLRETLEAVQDFEEDDGDTDHDLDSTEEVHTKEEIEIVEWQMPEQLKSKPMDFEGDCMEVVLHEDRNIMNIDHGSDSSKVISWQWIDLELKQEVNELIIDKGDAIESTGLSGLKKLSSLEASEETVGTSFEGKSSSICTSRDNSVEVSDANNMTFVAEEESAQLSNSNLNVTKSKLSYSKSPFSNRKSGFICDICQKSFQHKRILGIHVRVHYDDRLFSCSVCGKSFKQDTVRYMHELRHLRDRKCVEESDGGIKKKLYSCPICSKNFSSKKGLNLHSNLHSDKHKCKLCGKRFTFNYNLTMHLRTHTKEKLFKCEVCFKCFNLKGNLNTHLHIHSTERPISCDICDKRFKSKKDKTRHELSHLRKK